ncbi:MAG: MFS transporter [Aquabacterium sp.]
MTTVRRDAARPSTELPGPMGRNAVATMFLAFAVAYFLSALVRASVATLAPALSAELSLTSADLGLLAGAYFLGFSVMQLPMGIALDRFGPKRVQLSMLVIAVLGCAGFALAKTQLGLLTARFLIGAGVAGCLMAPLTAYRQHMAASAQLRANAWMLMVGSLGMLTSTVPVQWAAAISGWRVVFALVAVALLCSVVLIWILVPADPARPTTRAESSGYRDVVSEATFRRLAPLGFSLYGGLVAMQALWIGPWLTLVVGRTAQEAAWGLLLVNATMMLAFLAWGWLAPRLAQLGWPVDRVISVCWPASVLALVTILWMGHRADEHAWAAWCIVTSAINLSQPAVALAQPGRLAGRALSAYNLVIFIGVFAVQWGVGLLMDQLLSMGFGRDTSLRLALGFFALSVAAAGLWFQFKRQSPRPGAR